MDTQVQRVVQWREQKRQAGYQPLTVWLKAEVKHLIEDLAVQRRQDPAQVIAEAIQAYAGMHRPPAPPEYVDAPTVRRLVVEYVQELTAIGQLPPAPAPDVPLPPPRLPEERSAVLLRGEYGWVVQAVRAAARELVRFTCEQMARHIDYNPDNVHSTLKHLTKRGELSKKGRVYFWVDPTTPD
jgi:hypothetical protein